MPLYAIVYANDNYKLYYWMLSSYINSFCLSLSLHLPIMRRNQAQELWAFVKIAVVINFWRDKYLEEVNAEAFVNAMCLYISFIIFLFTALQHAAVCSRWWINWRPFANRRPWKPQPGTADEYWNYLCIKTAWKASGCIGSSLCNYRRWYKAFGIDQDTGIAAHGARNSSIKNWCQ